MRDPVPYNPVLPSFSPEELREAREEGDLDFNDYMKPKRTDLNPEQVQELKENLIEGLKKAGVGQSTIDMYSQDHWDLESVLMFAKHITQPPSPFDDKKAADLIKAIKDTDKALENDPIDCPECGLPLVLEPGANACPNCGEYEYDVDDRGNLVHYRSLSKGIRRREFGVEDLWGWR